MNKVVDRAEGERVILIDGRLLAWLSRGGHHVATFLAENEPEATQDAQELARALADLAGTPRAHGPRSMMIATIDGVPAPESPLANVLAEHGFVARQGSLVLIPATSTFGRRRPGARAPAWAAHQEEEEDVGISFTFPSASSEVELDGEDPDVDGFLETTDAIDEVEQDA